MTPTSVLQDVLTEGDTGAPIFSDRDGSEDLGQRNYVVLDEYRTFTVEELGELVERIRLKVVRAEMLGHRTVSLDDLKDLLPTV